MKIIIPHDCCECEEGMDPCTCDSECELECRSKSGEAELCGFSEYTDASVPPKKYRRRTLSGSTTIAGSSSPDCSSPTGESTTTYSGSCVIDPETCEQIESATVVVDAGTPIEVCELGFNECFLQETYTPTSRTQTGNGTTCCQVGPSNWNLIVDAGTRTEELLDEDTEADAITRALADIPDWSEAGECSLVSAFHTTRGAGQFHFSFSSVQVRARINNPTLGAFYQITIHYVERPLSSGEPYVDFGRQDVVVVQADEDAETEDWTDWVDVPIVEGLEIQAGGCEVEPL